MRFAVVIALIFLSTVDSGAAVPQRLHFYIGAGPNYSFPGTLRVGYKEWEGGQLINGAYGVQKRFFLQKHSYVSFGPTLVAITPQIGFGFSGSVGFDLLLGWGIGFRGEAVGIADHNGYLSARGVLGVSIAL